MEVKGNNNKLNKCQQYSIFLLKITFFFFFESQKDCRVCGFFFPFGDNAWATYTREFNDIWPEVIDVVSSRNFTNRSPRTFDNVNETRWSNRGH